GNDGMVANQHTDHFACAIADWSGAGCAWSSGLLLHGPTQPERTASDRGRCGLRSLDLAAACDFPNRFHPLASHTVDLIVHVDGAANVVRNYRQSLADAILTRRATDVQVAMFFGEALHICIRICLDQAVTASVLYLMSVRRECLGSGVDDRSARNARA